MAVVWFYFTLLPHHTAAAAEGTTTMPAASVQPEAPDDLLEALNGASIDEEHRTTMSAVIQKVQSAKSGLSEACAILLTGFEVSVFRI